MNYYKVEFTPSNGRQGIVSAETLTEASRIAEAWVEAYNEKRRVKAEGGSYTPLTLVIQNISVAYDLFTIPS